MSSNAEYNLYRGQQQERGRGAKQNQYGHHVPSNYPTQYYCSETETHLVGHTSENQSNTSINQAKPQVKKLENKPYSSCFDKKKIYETNQTGIIGQTLYPDRDNEDRHFELALIMSLKEEKLDFDTKEYRDELNLTTHRSYPYKNQDLYRDESKLTDNNSYDNRQYKNEIKPMSYDYYPYEQHRDILSPTDHNLYENNGLYENEWKQQNNKFKLNKGSLLNERSKSLKSQTKPKSSSRSTFYDSHETQTHYYDTRSNESIQYENDLQMAISLSETAEKERQKYEAEAMEIIRMQENYPNQNNDSSLNLSNEACHNKKDEFKAQKKLKSRLQLDLINDLFLNNSKPYSKQRILKIKSKLDLYKAQLNSTIDFTNDHKNHDEMSNNDISAIILEVISLLRHSSKDFTLDVLEYVKPHIENIALECSSIQDIYIFNPEIDDIDEASDCLHHAFSEEFACVRIKGDGNCLWNSISFSLFGDYSYMESLRLLTAATLLKYRIQFMKHLNTQKEKFGYNHDLTFEQLVSAAIELSVWGDEYHILALSLALERPIYSYGSFLKLIGDEKMNFEQLKSEYESETLPNHMRYVGYKKDENKCPIYIHYNGENHYSAILPMRKGVKPLVPKMKLLDYVLETRSSDENVSFVNETTRNLSLEETVDTNGRENIDRYDYSRSNRSSSYSNSERDEEISQYKQKNNRLYSGIEKEELPENPKIRHNSLGGKSKSYETYTDSKREEVKIDIFEDRKVRDRRERQLREQNSAEKEREILSLRKQSEAIDEELKTMYDKEKLSENRQTEKRSKSNNSRIDVHDSTRRHDVRNYNNKIGNEPHAIRESANFKNDSLRWIHEKQEESPRNSGLKKEIVVNELTRMNNFSEESRKDSEKLEDPKRYTSINVQTPEPEPRNSVSEISKNYEIKQRVEQKSVPQENMDYENTGNFYEIPSRKSEESLENMGEEIGLEKKLKKKKAEQREKERELLSGRSLSSQISMKSGFGNSSHNVNGKNLNSDSSQRLYSKVIEYRKEDKNNEIKEVRYGVSKKYVGPNVVGKITTICEQCNARLKNNEITGDKFCPNCGKCFPKIGSGPK